MKHLSKPLALLVALAAPAAAGDSVSWGGTGCRLLAVTGQAHVAEMVCENRLAAAPTQTEATLQIPGLSVALSVNHMPGNIPDRFEVVVPDGYQAVPSEVDLPEDGRETILIYEWLGT